jgi:Protein of unknown function (DUF3800)
MTRFHVFADEAGDFDFARNERASTYFILCTVAMPDCGVAKSLLELRHELVWEGFELGDCFHATTDAQAVRDRVFAEICQHEFTVQATIMEKSKADPHVRKTRPRFYQYGWFYHFKYGAAPVIRCKPRLMVTAASIGTKKERKAFSGAVDDVMQQTLKCDWRTDFCPASADPCLQVADYCAWAIQRKWERDDARSYVLIKDRITYEYDLWKKGKKHHY